MLSFGWSEILIIAAFALIVVGPRELPAMLRNIGRMAGSVRRMGNEFKRELNKVAAIDEVTNIKKSLTNPLIETRKSIESEFNKMTDKGTYEPSGALKPFESDGESVHNAIKAKAGMDAAAQDAARVNMETAVKKGKASIKKREAAERAAAKSPKAPAKKASTKTRAKKPAATKAAPARTASAKPASTRTATAKKPAVVRTSAAKKPAAASPATKKPAARKPAKPATASAAVKKPAARKPAKPTTPKPRKTSAARATGKKA